MNSDFHMTDTAATRLKNILDRDRAGGASQDLKMRISVSGGGCSGFQYVFTFDEDTTNDDRIFEKDGAQVVIDEISLGLLQGASLDFEDELIGSNFIIKSNPNAVASCGCGSSFSPI